MDELLSKLEIWENERFPDAINSFFSNFDQDIQTSFIIRMLEENGMKVGLPDSDVLNAMFDLIKFTFLITLDMIANEDVRI